MIHITDTVTFDEREIRARFVRTAGPRGVNPNKDATGVELRVNLARSSMPREVKDRLIAIAGRHVTNTGVLIVVGRADRSQAQNRSAAYARLLQLLERAASPPAKRRPTRPSPVAKRKRLVAKERRSDVKRTRSTRADDS